MTLEYPPIWEGALSRADRQRTSIRNMEARFIDRMMQHHANMRTMVRGLAMPVARPAAAPASSVDVAEEDWGAYAPVASFDAYIPPPPKPERQPLSPLSAREIVDHVCETRGVAYRELVGRTKTDRIAHARAEAYYRLREERQLSWGQIGKLIGGRDHTTVYHGYHKHAARIGAAV